MNKYIVVIISEKGEVFKRVFLANQVNVLEGGQIALYDCDGYIAIIPKNALVYLEKE